MPLAITKVVKKNLSTRYIFVFVLKKFFFTMPFAMKRVSLQNSFI